MTLLTLQANNETTFSLSENVNCFTVAQGEDVIRPIPVPSGSWKAIRVFFECSIVNATSSWGGNVGIFYAGFCSLSRSIGHAPNEHFIGYTNARSDGGQFDFTLTDSHTVPPNTTYGYSSYTFAGRTVTGSYSFSGGLVGFWNRYETVWSSSYSQFSQSGHSWTPIGVEIIRPDNPTGSWVVKANNRGMPPINMPKGAYYQNAQVVSFMNNGFTGPWDNVFYSMNSAYTGPSGQIVNVTMDEAAYGPITHINFWYGLSANPNLKMAIRNVVFIVSSGSAVQ